MIQFILNILIFLLNQVLKGRLMRFLNYINVKKAQVNLSFFEQ